MKFGADDESLLKWLRAKQDQYSSLKNITIELIEEQPKRSINLCADGPKLWILKRIQEQTANGSAVAGLAAGGQATAAATAAQPATNSLSSDIFYCYTHDQWIQKLWLDWRPSSYHYPLIALNILIFLFGATGNIFVCLSVYRNQQLRSVTNYHIVNLAIADLLVIIICLPATSIWDVSLTWFFGTMACKMIMYLQDVSISVSVLTLAAISIDRYYAICYPLRFKSSLNQAKRVICLIWLLSLSIMAPDLIYLAATPSQELSEAGLDTVLYSDCNYTWSDQSSRLFQYVKTILLYFLPVVFMFVAHFRIMNTLRVSSQNELYKFHIQQEEEAAALKINHHKKSHTIIRNQSNERRQNDTEDQEPYRSSRTRRTSQTHLGPHFSQVSEGSPCEQQQSHVLGDTKPSQISVLVDDNEEQATPGGRETCTQRQEPLSESKTTQPSTPPTPPADINNKLNYTTDSTEHHDSGRSVAASAQNPLPRSSITGCLASNEAITSGARSPKVNQHTTSDLAKPDRRNLAPSSPPYKLDVEKPGRRSSPRRRQSWFATTTGSFVTIANGRSPNASGICREKRNSSANLLPGDTNQMASQWKNSNNQSRRSNSICVAMHNKSQLDSRRNAAKMLMAIVIFFGFCNLPVHLMNFLRLVKRRSRNARESDYTTFIRPIHDQLIDPFRTNSHSISSFSHFIKDLPQNDFTLTLSMVAHSLCHLNSAINPIIYNYMNSIFREEFRKSLACIMCKSEPAASTQSVYGHRRQSLYQKDNLQHQQQLRYDGVHDHSTSRRSTQRGFVK